MQDNSRGDVGDHSLLLTMIGLLVLVILFQCTSLEGLRSLGTGLYQRAMCDQLLFAQNLSCTAGPVGLAGTLPSGPADDPIVTEA